MSKPVNTADCLAPFSAECRAWIADRVPVLHEVGPLSPAHVHFRVPGSSAACPRRTTVEPVALSNESRLDWAHGVTLPRIEYLVEVRLSLGVQ